MLVPATSAGFRSFSLLQQRVELRLVEREVLLGNRLPARRLELALDGAAEGAAPVAVLAVDGDRLLCGFPGAVGDGVLEGLDVGDAELGRGGPALVHPVAVLFGIRGELLVDDLGRAEAEEVRDLVLGSDVHQRDGDGGVPVEDAGLDLVLDDRLLVGLGALGGVRLAVDPHRFDLVLADLPVDGVKGHVDGTLELFARASSRAAERPLHAEFEHLGGLQQRPAQRSARPLWAPRWALRPAGPRSAQRPGAPPSAPEQAGPHSPPVSARGQGSTAVGAASLSEYGTSWNACHFLLETTSVDRTKRNDGTESGWQAEYVLAVVSPPYLMHTGPPRPAGRRQASNAWIQHKTPVQTKIRAFQKTGGASCAVIAHEAPPRRHIALTGSERAVWLDGLVGAGHTVAGQRRPVACLQARQVTGLRP